jgi:hypothetical protein
MTKSKHSIKRYKICQQTSQSPTVSTENVKERQWLEEVERETIDMVSLFL